MMVMHQCRLLRNFKQILSFMSVMSDFSLSFCSVSHKIYHTVVQALNLGINCRRTCLLKLEATVLPCMISGDQKIQHEEEVAESSEEDVASVREDSQEEPSVTKPGDVPAKKDASTKDVNAMVKIQKKSSGMNFTNVPCSIIDSAKSCFNNIS